MGYHGWRPPHSIANAVGFLAAGRLAKDVVVGRIIGRSASGQPVLGPCPESRCLELSRLEPSCLGRIRHGAHRERSRRERPWKAETRSMDSSRACRMDARQLRFASVGGTGGRGMGCSCQRTTAARRLGAQHAAAVTAASATVAAVICSEACGCIAPSLAGDEATATARSKPLAHRPSARAYLSWALRAYAHGARGVERGRSISTTHSR